MKTLHTLLTCVLGLVISAAYSQHHAATPAATSTPPMSFKPVLTQLLSDPDLKGYTMESLEMTIAPGGADTVAHRHDCELFGYVIEGEVEIGLEKKEPNKFSAGQMFYEKRNVLHSLARNGSKDKTARVLLVFILKEGRVRYTPEYPKK